MKVTINLTKQEAIESLLQFYKHTGASEIVISDEATDDGWISNVGRDKFGHPESLNPDTKIKVKFRDGRTDTKWAEYWNMWWKEANEDDAIVAYRILKD